MENKAVVMFSGGLDSTTALYWAKKHFKEVFAVNFFYSQRHSIESDMAKRICDNLNIDLTHIEIPLKGILKSSLIDENGYIPEDLKSSKDENNTPFTYVPFRNGIFLSIITGFAESREIYDIVTGFNLIDTPDYPDTTKEFVKKMEDVINEGTAVRNLKREFKIHTPLINLSKREIIELGLRYNADYSYSISCYRGSEIPCDNCPSCDIRNNAFKELGIEDPLKLRLKKEGKYGV